MGAFTAVAAYGISTSISSAMGSNDTAEIAKIKSASVYITAVMAVLSGFIQIPFVIFIINSYHLSALMHALTWEYAIGSLLCTPLSLISTVGTLQLQISGKMKALMVLTIAEGLANTVFDLIFVAGFRMGVAERVPGDLCLFCDHKWIIVEKESCNHGILRCII